ncbi:MAG: M48 family metalloprotease [Myxococcaceae bacterium]|nr:M48 family metalloprotease [Myxococcaceae bacterium]
MSPPRIGPGVLLASLLTACQATDRPALVAQVERKVEAQRRQLNRDLAGPKARLGGQVSALMGCSLERRQAYELDPEQEHTLGRAVAERQLATLGVEPLPPTDPVARYVDHVGQYLALVAEAVGNASAPDRTEGPERLLGNRPWPLEGYRFLVLPLGEPRASGGPGGTVMISTGFLLGLESEEELAAVLAHEVAHVQRGHGVEALKDFLCHQEARRQPLAAFGNGLTAQLFQRRDGAQRAQGQRVLAELSTGEAKEAANLYREELPWDFELEADRISVRLLLAAGYDARVLTGLLRRTAQEAPARHAWLRMHPPSSERLETVGQQLEGLGAAQAWPSSEAVAQRTRRFQDALAPLRVLSISQSAR